MKLLENVLGKIKPFRGYNNEKVLFAISLIIMISLASDLLISYMYIGGVSLSPSWAIAAYAIISVVFIITQYLILGFVQKMNKEVSKTPVLIDKLGKSIIVIVSVFTALLISVFLFMILTSYYPSSLLAICLAISYISTIFIFGILSLRFLSWYRSSNNFLVMLYGISSLALSIRVITALTLYMLMLADLPADRTAEQPILIVLSEFEIEPTSILGIFQSAYSISSIVAGMMLWISTALILYYHKIGHIKYFILIGVFPIYFMSDYVIQFVPYASPINPLSVGFDLFSFTIFLAFQGIVAGILFGIPFWIMARRFQHKNKLIRDYMIICGAGFIIFYMSFSAVIVHAPYPPFGLHNVLVSTLSSYIILIGLYFSAISVSSDYNLRSYIRRSVKDRSRFLGSIGSAEMEQELARNVSSIAKKQFSEIQETTGVQPSLSEEEVKQYLANAIDEVKRKKKVGGSVDDRSRK
jgi:hypothetical protein